MNAHYLEEDLVKARTEIRGSLEVDDSFSDRYHAVELKKDESRGSLRGTYGSICKHEYSICPHVHSWRMSLLVR